MLRWDTYEGVITEEPVPEQYIEVNWDYETLVQRLEQVELTEPQFQRVCGWSDHFRAGYVGTEYQCRDELRAILGFDIEVSDVRDAIAQLIRITRLSELQEGRRRFRRGNVLIHIPWARSSWEAEDFDDLEAGDMLVAYDDESRRITVTEVPLLLLPLQRGSGIIS